MYVILNGSISVGLKSSNYVRGLAGLCANTCGKHLQLNKSYSNRILNHPFLFTTAKPFLSPGVHRLQVLHLFWAQPSSKVKLISKRILSENNPVCKRSTGMLSDLCSGLGFGFNIELSCSWRDVIGHMQLMEDVLMVVKTLVKQK